MLWRGDYFLPKKESLSLRACMQICKSRGTKLTLFWHLTVLCWPPSVSAWVLQRIQCSLKLNLVSQKHTMHPNQKKSRIIPVTESYDLAATSFAYCHLLLIIIIERFTAVHEQEQTQRDGVFICSILRPSKYGADWIQTWNSGARIVIILVKLKLVWGPPRAEQLRVFLATASWGVLEQQAVPRWWRWFRCKRVCPWSVGPQPRILPQKCVDDLRCFCQWLRDWWSQGKVVQQVHRSSRNRNWCHMARTRPSQERSAPCSGSAVATVELLWCCGSSWEIRDKTRAHLGPDLCTCTVGPQTKEDSADVFSLVWPQKKADQSISYKQTKFRRVNVCPSLGWKHCVTCTWLTGVSRGPQLLWGYWTVGIRPVDPLEFISTKNFLTHRGKQCVCSRCFACTLPFLWQIQNNARFHAGTKKKGNECAAHETMTAWSQVNFSGKQ